MSSALILAAILAQAPEPTSRVDASPSAVPGPGRPRLHIVADRTPLLIFQLQEDRAHGTSSSEPLCVAPCDAVIDGSGGAGFYFGAPGIAPSVPFALRDLKGSQEVHVRAGNQRLTVFGFIASSLGMCSLVGSLSALFSDVLPLTLSLTGVIAGAVLAAVGGLVIYEGRTTYEFIERPDPPPAILFAGR
jgi:hypothetical protein